MISRASASARAWVVSASWDGFFRTLDRASSKFWGLVFGDGGVVFIFALLRVQSIGLSGMLRECVVNVPECQIVEGVVS